MPSKTWGTPQVIQQSIVVDENTEIPIGHKAYVFNKTTSTIGEFVPKDDWEAFMRGDLYALKERIEADIYGSKVIWLKISWDKTEGPKQIASGLSVYAVWGFYVEAIVENASGANLTGFEIAAIILALAVLIPVLAALALGAWTYWEVVQSVKRVLGDVGMIGIGLLLLFGLAIFVLLILGVGFKGKGIAVGK